MEVFNLIKAAVEQTAMEDGNSVVRTGRLVRTKFSIHQDQTVMVFVPLTKTQEANAAIRLITTSARYAHKTAAHAFIIPIAAEGIVFIPIITVAVEEITGCAVAEEALLSKEHAREHPRIRGEEAADRGQDLVRVLVREVARGLVLDPGQDLAPGQDLVRVPGQDLVLRAVPQEDQAVDRAEVQAVLVPVAEAAEEVPEDRAEEVPEDQVVALAEVQVVDRVEAAAVEVPEDQAVVLAEGVPEDRAVVLAVEVPEVQVVDRVEEVPEDQAEDQAVEVPEDQVVDRVEVALVVQVAEAAEEVPEVQAVVLAEGVPKDQAVITQANQAVIFQAMADQA